MIDLLELHKHTIKLITQLMPRACINEQETADIKKNVVPRIVIALSGGADSVFLLHLLTQIAATMELTLIVAHLNHGWRGAADEADMQFCKALADQHNLMFVTAHSSNIVINKRWNGSQEELGRHQRHTFLQNVATDFQAHGIALGHNAQDQEENFFIRLMRGSSLDGLCGMYEYEKNLIRPLLTINRADIEHWLISNHKSWCTDSDNDTSRFLRNRIRHDLLPVIHTIDLRFEQNFARTLHQLQQEQALIEILVTQSFATIFDDTGKGDLKKFNALHQMLQGHILKKLFITHQLSFNLSESFIQEVRRFLNSSRGGTHELNNKWACTKKSSFFWFTSTK